MLRTKLIDKLNEFGVPYTAHAELLTVFETNEMQRLEVWLTKQQTGDLMNVKFMYLLDQFAEFAAHCSTEVYVMTQVIKAGTMTAKFELIGTMANILGEMIKTSIQEDLR